MQPENEDFLKLSIIDKKTEGSLNKLANVQKSQTSKWEYGFINGEWSFTPPIEYFQCVLQRKTGDSVVEMTTYLPGKFAAVGKQTLLKELAWVVAKVYSSLPKSSSNDDFIS